MARGRMIATTVADDKRLNDLSIEAELVYLKSIPHLDRDGLILGEPLVLWGKACRRRPELMAKMGAVIMEWIHKRLVIAYDTEDGRVLFFVGFAKNQTGMHYSREAASVFPEPPGYYRNGNGLSPIEEKPAPPTNSDNNGGATPDEVRINSGQTPAEMNVKLSGSLNRNECDAPLAPITHAQDELERVCQCWQVNMRKEPSTKERRQLAVLLKETALPNVIHGIIAAASRDKPYVEYVATCARNYVPGQQPRAAPNAPASGPAYPSVEKTAVLIAGRSDVTSRHPLTPEEMKRLKEREERDREEALVQRKQQQLQQGRQM